MAVRVVRVMEYYYDTLAEANADMRLWHVPQSGEKSFKPGNIVRSSVLGPQQLSEDNKRDFQDAPVDRMVPIAWTPSETRDDFAYRKQVQAHAEATGVPATGVEIQQGFGEGRA